MNKFDFLLIIFLIAVISLFFLFRNNHGNVANVYYENEIVKTIDLSFDDIYVVEGDNGDVVIEVNDNKIRVKEENSPRHLCSKQGYGELIVCLPNKIVIKVEDNNLDGVVR